MAWEQRRNGRYYYRKAKHGGRVVSEYVGAGYVAEAMARIDEADRQRRKAAAKQWRAIVADDQRHADELAAVDDLVKSAVAAVLLANGYHTHRRQWRKVAR